MTTDGDIRLTGASGNPQMEQLSLEGARNNEGAYRSLKVPSSYLGGAPADIVPGNVARIHARMASDVRHGTSTAPSFEGAVELHKLIAAIETAAMTGRRVTVTARNRPLPVDLTERLAG